MKPPNNDTQEPSGDDLGADQWRERMLYIAVEMLKKPDRDLTPEEMALFVKGAMALAEMFVTMDQALCGGFVPPRAWMRDVPKPGEIPASPLHGTLKAEADHLVMKILERISEKCEPKTAKYLLENMTKLLSTLALFTSESVRLACLNNLKPEAEAGRRLSLVHDADKKEN